MARARQRQDEGLLSFYSGLIYFSRFSLDEGRQWRLLERMPAGPNSRCERLPPLVDLAPALTHTGQPVMRYFGGKCDAIVIYQPHFAANATANKPTGISVAVLDRAILVGELLSELPADTLLSIRLSGPETSEQVIFDNTTERPGSRAHSVQALPHGDQTLHIEATAAEKHFAHDRKWQAWVVLGGGLLFSTIFCIGLLVISGRSVQTETLVKERTAQLADEIDKRQRAERLLQLQNEVLERVARDASLQQVLDLICLKFESLSPRTQASVMLAAPETGRLAIASGPSLAKPVFEALHDLPITDHH